MAIDEPFDQVAKNNGEGVWTGSNLLSLGAALTGLLSGDLSVVTVTTTAVQLASAVAAAFGGEQTRVRIEEMAVAAREEFRRVNGRLDGIEDKLSAPAAQETVFAAFRETLFTARVDKAQWFGRVLGHALGTQDADFQRAAEFIRDLERFSDDDVEALQILWKGQSKAFGVSGDGADREMSTDSNQYTNSWSGVLANAKRAGFSRDEWDSRCARLSGFGLALQVQSNPSYQPPDTVCYRLTTRAADLLRLLGVFVDPREFPKVKYHKSGDRRTVNSPDEERALGAGWGNLPSS